MEANKPRINVFITKTREFRVKIKEAKNEPTYEVTVGGVSWRDGKGREFEKEIYDRCNSLIDTLVLKLQDVQTKE